MHHGISITAPRGDCPFRWRGSQGERLSMRRWSAHRAVATGWGWGRRRRRRHCPELASSHGSRLAQGAQAGESGARNRGRRACKASNDPWMKLRWLPRSPPICREPCARCSAWLGSPVRNAPFPFRFDDPSPSKVCRGCMPASRRNLNSQIRNRTRQVLSSSTEGSKPTPQKAHGGQASVRKLALANSN